MLRSTRGWRRTAVFLLQSFTQVLGRHSPRGNIAILDLHEQEIKQAILRKSTYCVIACPIKGEKLATTVPVPALWIRSTVRRKRAVGRLSVQRAQRLLMQPGPRCTQHPVRVVVVHRHPGESLTMHNVLELVGTLHAVCVSRHTTTCPQHWCPPYRSLMPVMSANSDDNPIVYLDIVIDGERG